MSTNLMLICSTVCILCGSVRAQTCTSPPAGLIGWWTGDVDARDLCGTNDGLLLWSAAAGEAGYVDGAFNLNGIGAQVALDPAQINFANPDFPATINVWVRMNGTRDKTNPVLAFGDRDGNTVVFPPDRELEEDEVPLNDLTISLGHFTGRFEDEQVFVARLVDGQVEMGLATRLSDGGINVFDGQWHMVTVSFGAEVNIYVDSVLQTITPNDSGVNNGRFGGIPNADYANIGALIRDNGNWHFGGQLDELQLVSRELAQWEIQMLFAAGTCKSGAMIEKLCSDVAALNLANGINNALDTKLDAALATLEDLSDNNDVAACNSLEAFINQVEAQAGKEISVDDANNLILQAMEILVQLDCE